MIFVYVYFSIPQYEKILQYIKVAEEDGATCVLGGKPYTGDGVQGDRFVEPTIFTGVTNNMRIAQEEVFGPILSVIPFEMAENSLASKSLQKEIQIIG